MEPILTNLTVNTNDKRNNLKRPNSSSSIASCNKMSNFMIQSRSPSPAENITPGSNSAPTMKPNQVCKHDKKLLISPIKGEKLLRFMQTGQHSDSLWNSDRVTLHRKSGATVLGSNIEHITQAI